MNWHRRNQDSYVGYVTVNLVPTLIISYGEWVEDNVESMGESQAVAVVIPGNPGIVEYYDDFMKNLYIYLKRKIPVMGISHAGHAKIPPTMYAPPLHGNEDLYNLQGQIHHKLQFVEDYIPSDKKLILIGHSIGAHIILEMLRNIPDSRVLKCVLLFPTVENLALTPQGKWATPLLSYFQFMALFLVHILYYLSPRVQYKLLEWYFQRRPVAKCAIEASLNLFDPNCATFSMFMGSDEMRTVKDLDLEHFSDHKDKITMYYGVNDHWCPVEYYHALKNKFPLNDILLCDKGIDHAFVLESSKEVAELASGWIYEAMEELNDRIPIPSDIADLSD